MRLTNGLKCRVALEDGTTLVGTAARSWRWGVVRLNRVTAHARIGEVEAPQIDYFLVPVRRILLVQVSPE